MMAIQAQFYPDNFGFALGGSLYMMDNGHGFNEFCFNFQQKQQHQQLQSLQQKTQSPCFDNSGLLSKCHNNPQSMASSMGMAAQLEKQKQEIEWFICLQNERLRLALQEQRKQQIALILRKYEAKTAVLLKQKDEELTKAINRAMELEDFIRRMEIESQTWQRVARENEAMVASLNYTIEQLKENAYLAINGAEDAESCCDVNCQEDRENETGENGGESEEQRPRKMICKSCHSRSSCVIFLPCRHLCACEACQAFLDSCPVCGTAKKAIIEALI
ncbi:hypothetical protein NMG60_11015832 [Bertholletia excelsa]